MAESAETPQGSAENKPTQDSAENKPTQDTAENKPHCTYQSASSTSEKNKIEDPPQRNDYSNGEGNHSRTILIIGMVGVGKSTIARRILGGESELESRTPMEGFTRQSNKLKTITQKGHDGITYNLKIVDVSAQCDTTFQAHIKEDFEIVCSEPLNLILFVIQKGRISQTEKWIFELIAPKCPPEITSLIITFCETVNEDARSATIQNFREDEDSKEIAKCFINGIYTVGFPDLQTVKSKLKQIFEEEAEKDEKQLQKIIQEAKEPKSIHVDTTIVEEADKTTAEETPSKERLCRLL